MLIVAVVVVVPKSVLAVVVVPEVVAVALAVSPCNVPSLAATSALLSAKR